MFDNTDTNVSDNNNPKTHAGLITKRRSQGRRSAGGETTVARYFKYKTAEALEADALQRGLNIRLSSDFSPLTEPLTIGKKTAGNRMVIHPMEGCDSDLNGFPGELAFRRYKRFGAGGAKIIWAEATAVLPNGRANPRQLAISPSHAVSLKAVLDTVRAAHRESMGQDKDLLVGLQLTHSGRYGFKQPIIACHNPVLDARTVWDKTTGRTVAPNDPLINDDDLDRLQDIFARAAKLAYQIGFDFVDIKSCHGYLINELLGARSRPGKYGGSFKNRTRFLREVVARILKDTPGALVATRMNVFDGIPHHKGGPDVENIGVPDNFTAPYVDGWGNLESNPAQPDLTEPLELIAHLADIGLGMLSVTMGNPYAQPHYGRPFEYAPSDGYESPEHPLIGVNRHFDLTEKIQNANPALAVVGAGYSWLQEFAFHAAAANVRDKRALLAGIGRAALSQPETPRLIVNKLPVDRKKVCRTFSYCTALMRTKANEMGQFPTGCPPFDKEAYGKIWEDAQKVNPDITH